MTAEFVPEVGPAASLWPYEESEFSPDPTLVRGVLPNGLRYIIKKNSEPENRVAAFLGILAGSMQESDAQQGVAHFLEHLMFNGSTHFPPGTLIDYFQSIGMDFGGDTNAYTGFDRTVYHLILPSGQQKDLDTGCLVLADYARGALLLDSEIDQERGVIFSEKRARDSAEYRNQLAYSEFAFKGTRYAARFPIGKDSVLQNADHTLLKTYYDSWYRPDNMLLVLVGDLDTDAAVKAIQKNFAELDSPDLAPARQSFGKLELGELEVFYNYEPELGKVNVSVETLWDIEPEKQTKRGDRDDLAEIISEYILGYRLQRMQEEKDQPFVAAYYTSDEIVRRIGYGSLYGVTDKEHWKETLGALNIELARAIQFGFKESELQRARQEILAELKKDAEQEASLHSRIIAQRIIDHFMDNEVYMSPTQELDVYGAMIQTMTLNEVNSAFREIWSHKRRLVNVSGDLELGNNGVDQIKGAFKELEAKEVTDDVASKELVFPYLPVAEATAGQIEKVVLSGIDATDYLFPNGLVVHLKKTDFEDATLRLTANFGRGEQAETTAGMAFVADDVIGLSGTGKYSRSDLDSILAGSSANLSFEMGEASNSWYGSCLDSDIELQFQLLHTLLLDPGFSETAFKKVMQGLELMYQRFESDIDGAAYLKVQPFFAGNNIHFGLPAFDAIQKLDYQSLKQWVSSTLQVRDLEISIVGDFDEMRIIGLLRKYFGGLVLSPPPARRSEEKIAFPEGQTLEVEIGSEIEKSRVYVSWPTDDFWDISRTRRLNILAGIIENRLIKVVREKMGASYSPEVSSIGSRVYTGFGYLVVEVNVKKGMEERIIGEVRRLAVDLRRGKIEQDELERAKNPIVTSVLENIKTNQYWLYSVLSLSSSNPEQLLWPTTIVGDIKHIKVDDVLDLAQKYLVDEKSAVVIIRAEEQSKNCDDAKL